MDNQWKMCPPSDWMAVPVNDNGETLVHVIWPVGYLDTDDVGSVVEVGAGIETGWVRPDDIESLQAMLQVCIAYGGVAVWHDGVRVFERV